METFITIILGIIVLGIGLLIVTSPIWITMMIITGWKVGRKTGGELRQWVDK